MAKKDYYVIKGHDGISYACTIINAETCRPEVALRPAEKVEGNVEVPAQVEINGKMYPVTVIEENAFSQMRMKTVTLPDTVVKIEASAFQYCEYLREVYLGNSLQRIGDTAFEGCKWLVYMPIPDTLTHVGHFAFRDTGMVDIQIQRGAIYLGHILYGYNGYLPKHSYIEVRKGTTVIADSAFNSKFEHRYDCRNLEGIVLPQGMKRIGASAFFMCQDLAYVNIPRSVEYIGASAFNGTSIREVTVARKKPINIGSGPFNDHTVIYVPKGTAEIYSKAVDWGWEWKHYQFIEK